MPTHNNKQNKLQSQRVHDVIKKPIWRPNDVATSFLRNNDVIITSYVRKIHVHIYCKALSEWGLHEFG